MRAATRLALRLILLGGVSATAAVDDAIEGIKPAALDQPRIYLQVQRTVSGLLLTPPPKAAKRNDSLNELLDGSAFGPSSTQLRAGGGILESLAPGMDLQQHEIGLEPR